jgi:hypothetical protein
MSAIVATPPGAAQEPQSAEHIMRLCTGYIASISINIVARLGIADLLKDGPLTTAELAKTTSTNEDRLYRMMRALATVGVFTETAPKTFALTPAADALRSDAPGSVRAMVLWLSDPLHFNLYAELMHSVKTGEITFDHLKGVPVFSNTFPPIRHYLKFSTLQ